VGGEIESNGEKIKHVSNQRGGKKSGSGVCARERKGSTEKEGWGGKTKNGTVMHKTANRKNRGGREAKGTWGGGRELQTPTKKKIKFVSSKEKKGKELVCEKTGVKKTVAEGKKC